MNKRLTELRTMRVQKEVKNAPMVLIKDDLTKAKRALRVLKVLCLIAGSLQELEFKAQLDAEDRSAISKM